MHYRMISQSISFLGGNVLNSWTERSYVSMSLFSFRMSPLSAVLAEDHLSFVDVRRLQSVSLPGGLFQLRLHTKTIGHGHIWDARTLCVLRAIMFYEDWQGSAQPGPLGHAIQLYGLVISVWICLKIGYPPKWCFFPVLFLRWQS